MLSGPRVNEKRERITCTDFPRSELALEQANLSQQSLMLLFVRLAPRVAG